METYPLCDGIDCYYKRHFPARQNDRQEKNVIDYEKDSHEILCNLCMDDYNIDICNCCSQHFIGPSFHYLKNGKDKIYICRECVDDYWELYKSDKECLLCNTEISEDCNYLCDTCHEICYTKFAFQTWSLDDLYKNLPNLIEIKPELNEVFQGFEDFVNQRLKKEENKKLQATIEKQIEVQHLLKRFIPSMSEDDTIKVSKRLKVDDYHIFKINEPNDDFFQLLSSYS